MGNTKEISSVDLVNIRARRINSSEIRPKPTNHWLSCHLEKKMLHKIINKVRIEYLYSLISGGMSGCYSVK